MEFILLAAWLTVADRWEPYHLSPRQMEWFSRLQSPANALCCSVADGWPADDWKRQTSPDGSMHYWVLFENKWWQVPDEAVILSEGNPVGVPVVWFTAAKDAIRCFVPGPEN